MAPKRWSPYKSLIMGKYLVENQSVGEIMTYMQEKENFFASKSAYERQLRAWGCHKNLTDVMWKFIRLRLQEREAEGKKSDVYFYGNLVDGTKVQNRIARVYTTFAESRIALRPTTPDNVAIIPPVSPLYLDIVKSDRFPWQQFCELAEPHTNLDILIQLPGDMRRIMAPYLVPEPISTNDTSAIVKRIVEYFATILPLDYDEEIYHHLRLAFAETSQRSTWEFLRLTVYLLSNKLLLQDENDFNRFRSGVKIISDEILKWFQIGNNRTFCHAILGIKVPSTDAFAETIFCSAVEKGVTSMIRMFLESGIDPNTFVEHNGDSLTPLQFAAVTQNVEMARVLLEYGADTKARDTRVTLLSCTNYKAFPQTPLQIAARKGNLELVQLLIFAGAAVNTDQSFWSSALQNAAKARHYKISQLLLDAGADIDACFGHYGCALACAIEEECKQLINLLLDNNADVSSSGPSDITPLQSAAMVNDEDMVSDLLNRGAKVNTSGYSCRVDGARTALHWAVKNGNKNIVSLLINAGEDVNRKSKGSMTKSCFEVEFHDRREEVTALEVAIEKRDDEMVSILLDAGADPSKDNSVLVATKTSNVKLVSELLWRGADINRVSDYHPMVLLQAASAQDLEMIKFLLSRGADTNLTLRGKSWESCLQMLIRERRMEIIEVLIQAGADFNRAWSSDCPSNLLQGAVFKGDLELVKYFIAVGADVNWLAFKNFGRSALQQAVEKGYMHIVEFLLKFGADVNAPAATWYGVTALQAAVSRNDLDLVELLLENGANPDDRPSSVDGLSALQRAAWNGNNDLILKLVSAGARVNGPPGDEGGYFAIQAAALKGYVTTIELLLQLDADINAPACSMRGLAALQAAVSKGHLRITELLLKRGADVNALGSLRDLRCGAALTVAACHGYIRITKLLLARGANVIEKGTIPALFGAARYGRIDMMKLIITQALKSPEFNRNHLKRALETANNAGHTAAAKFLECHYVIMGSSCRLNIGE